MLLSGGAAPEQFERVLSYSYAAGAQGFLAGRTIWLDAIQNHFPDRQAVFDALNDSGMDILKSLRRLTKAEARPWEPQIDFSHIGREGAFSCAYA